MTLKEHINDLLDAAAQELLEVEKEVLKGTRIVIECGVASVSVEASSLLHQAIKEALDEQIKRVSARMDRVDSVFLTTMVMADTPLQAEWLPREVLNKLIAPYTKEGL